MNRFEKYLPKFVGEIHDIHDVLEAIEHYFLVLDQEIEDLENDGYIHSATERGIERYERLFKLPINMADSLESRRSAVMAKLRSDGTTNGALIKLVARAFEAGEVDVTMKPGKYIVHVKFVSVYGVPKNKLAFERAIRDLMPAHLDLEFEYSYMTWVEFDNYNKTWKAWDGLNLTWPQFEAFKGD